MLEIGMLVAICVGVGKVADSEGRSSMVWGIITLVICLACLAIPLPFLRILLAGLIAFIFMMIAKARDRR